MDVLDFHPEYNLTSEPLRIDCVVIKKAKGAVIEKNIAAIFRGVNLVEYKNPTDYLSIDDFYNHPDRVPLTSVFKANLFDTAQLARFFGFFRSDHKLD